MIINISTEDGRIELEIPSEIGDVVAQHTSIGAKFSLMASVNIWGYMGFVTLFFMMIPVMYIAPLMGTGVVLAVCALLFTLFFFFKKESVGIVGTQGFVVYTLSKRTQLVVSREVYLFKEAVELIFPQTANFLNGVYTSTSFKFRLSNGENDLYKQSGKYHNLKEEKGKYGWKYPFLCDIENAWTSFLLNDSINGR